MDIFHQGFPFLYIVFLFACVFCVLSRLFCMAKTEVLWDLCIFRGAGLPSA